MEGVLVIIFS